MIFLELLVSIQN